MTEVQNAPPMKSWRVRLPFISTTFANNLLYFALAWPLWWILGIEQILWPIFLAIEFIRMLIRFDWKFRLNPSGFIAVLIALWWGVPIFWLNREFMDIFLKEYATIWGQAFLLILIWNHIQTREEWHQIIRALMIMAAYTAIAGLVFLFGMWQGSILSFFGRLLPQSLIESSSFFSSIAIREFGLLANEIGLVPQRLMAFSMSFSSLSMVCLMLIPLVYWRQQWANGATRLGYMAILIGLILCLVYTESRISYLAFMVAVGIYLILRLGFLQGKNRMFSIALVFLGIVFALVVGYIAIETLLQSFRSAFIDLRPGSWLVRLNIYIVTFQLLPEHLFAGWGVPVRIPGAPSDYSAGTHSSYLGVLFQHGLIGLLLYLSLWISVWKPLLKNIRQRHKHRDLALFYMAITAAFIAFNIREIADSWWWDQSLTFVVWLSWGASLTASRCIANHQS